MPVLEDVYPSRMTDPPNPIDRVDPVVYAKGTPPGPLTPERVHQYETRGFLTIPNLFSDGEVADFRRELFRLSNNRQIRGLPETVTELESGDVRSVFRVHEISSLFSRLCRDPRLMRTVQYLLDDDVYIHQSRVNFKPGFRGNGFYWHSDFETWHAEDGIPRMRTISASISLTDNNEFNGPLMLIPGSHQVFIPCEGETPEDYYKRSLQRQDIGVPDERALTGMVEASGIRSSTGPAGSVTFFDCNTMHGSGSNITPYPRSNVFFVYNSFENRVVDPFCGAAPRPEYLAARKNIEPLRLET